MVTNLNQPLFFEKEMKKTAQVKVSNDVNEWDENVMEHLHEEYPELTDNNIEVVFKKSDAQRGYGYGYVGLGKEAEVKIPIIIKEYEMAPLDVMMHEGQAYPLTKDSIKGLLQKTAMGKTIPKPGGVLAYAGPNISEKAYPGIPWTAGHYKYASMLSALDLTQEQLNGFRAKLEGDPELVASWNESSCKGILKIASASGANPDEVAAGDGHPLVDAFIKRFDGGGDWGPVETAGNHDVKGTSGLNYSGYVYPKVFDFHLQPIDVTLFADGELKDEDYKQLNTANNKCEPQVTSAERYGYSCVQQSIMGKKSSDVGNKDGCRDACKGETGFFIIKRGGATMAFTPVNILSKSRINEKREIDYHQDDIDQNVEIKKNYTIYKYAARDSFGALYRLVVSPNMKEVKMVNGLVMLPGDARWVRMEKMVKLKSAGDSMKKIAYTGPSITMRHLGGESFSLEAPWADAWLREGDLRGKVASELGKYYNEDSLKTVFEECEKDGMVHFNDRAPKSAPEINKYAGVNRIARDLTKEAASLGDTGLVDTVLSLQFINKDNVEKYIGFLPQLEKAASHLADLLIGSRLGVNMEEYPVKTAMENIVEIIDDLRLLKAR